MRTLYGALFNEQIRILPYITLGKVSSHGGRLKIEFGGKDKKVHMSDFDNLFQIRNKINAHLAEIQGYGTAESHKENLKLFKDKLVEKINKGRWLWMSGEEKRLLDDYFNQMNDLIDTPAPGIVSRFLKGALKVGAAAAAAYGVYRYFGQ